MEEDDEGISPAAAGAAAAVCFSRLVAQLVGDQAGAGDPGAALPTPVAAPSSDLHGAGRSERENALESRAPTWFNGHLVDLVKAGGR